MATELMNASPMTLSKTGASGFASVAGGRSRIGVMNRADLSKRGCQILEALDEIFELLESDEMEWQGE